MQRENHMREEMRDKLLFFSRPNKVQGFQK
jgi:hypothetical protein